MLRSSLRALKHQTAPPAASSLAVRAGVPYSSASCARTRRARSRCTRRQLLGAPASVTRCPACRGLQASVVSHAQQRLAHSGWLSCLSGDRRAYGSNAEHAASASARAESHTMASSTAAAHDGGSVHGVSLRGNPQQQPWTNSVRIARGEVHVWWLHPDKAAEDPSRLTQYEALLSPGEALQLAAAPTAELRRERLLARTLTRTVLSRYCHPICGPIGLRFHRNGSGKPALTWPAALDHCDGAALHFNLSHTRGLMGLAVALGVDVGLDVETADRAVRSDPLRLARRRFSPAEAASLDVLSDPLERQRRFLKLWTLKEAYVKAVGRGISGYPGLAGFTVDPRPCGSDMDPLLGTAAHELTERIPHVRPPMLREEVTFVPPEGESAGEWRFELMQPAPQHMAAVCVRTDDRIERCEQDRTLHIVAREVLPLVWDRELDQGSDLVPVGGVMPMSKL